MKYSIDAVVNSLSSKVKIATLIAVASLGIADRAKALGPTEVGYMFNTGIYLGTGGWDTAGSNDPNVNYFHTTNGIEVRDRKG
jgi:hypothetical protein